MQNIFIAIVYHKYIKCFLLKSSLTHYHEYKIIVHTQFIYAFIPVTCVKITIKVHTIKKVIYRLFPKIKLFQSATSSVTTNILHYYFVQLYKRLSHDLQQYIHIRLSKNKNKITAHKQYLYFNRQTQSVSSIQDGI